MNKRDNTTFNDDDITVAAIMSNFAAISIRNAEIHENLQSTNLALKAELPSADNVIGENREVRKVFKDIKKNEKYKQHSINTWRIRHWKRGPCKGHT
ncbi:MAG: hypothetical protein GY777_23800 [Candidatus Brocadiaceae bacterium]|nr:hypothetical protein [Candidatus Brocadiaceae bacterium]